MGSVRHGHWTDYLFCGLRVLAKSTPIVGRAVEVIEEVDRRREEASRHQELQESLSRVERTLIETARREILASLETLQHPNLSDTRLAEEMRNLHDVRRMGFDPFLFEGLMGNSSFFSRLKERPHLFGRVLENQDVPRPDAFYLFIDADRTRLLELSPFALQQILGHQDRGVPKATLIGGADIFARVAEAREKAPGPVAASHTRMVQERVGSSGTWTEEAFLASSPANERVAHAELLSRLREGGIAEPRFDASGPTNPTYKVYLTGTDVHVLWVYAEGRLYVTWKPLRTAGLSSSADLWRSMWNGFVNVANRNDSFATGGLRRVGVHGVVNRISELSKVISGDEPRCANQSLSTPSIEASARHTPTSGNELGLSERGVPPVVLTAIESRAAREHPDKFETQAYVVAQDTAAYKRLASYAIADVPPEIIARIKQRAAHQHPDNYSTQLYVVDEAVAAFKRLSNCGTMGLPAEVVLRIKNKAAEEHPDNFATQAYVLENEVKAYRKLHRHK